MRPRPEPESKPGARSRQAWRGPAAAALLAAFVAYLAFNAGGFFPDATAAATLAACLAMAAVLLLLRRPLQDLGRDLALPLGLLAAFAAWTLVSALWSGAVWRTLVEFDRALLYLLVFALFGMLGADRRSLAWGLRGIAGVAIVVCAIGWTTRVAADVWPIGPNINPERLSYPLTYWNSLGLLAVLGILACLHLSSERRESRPWQAAAAAAVPLLASVLLLTLSRGAIAVVVLGLVVYALLSRARRLLLTLAAVAVPTAVALVASYQASVLSSARFASPEGVSEGHRLALIVLGCVVAAALLRLLLTRADAALDAWAPPVPKRRTLFGAFALAAIALLALLVLFDVPGRVGDQYEGFVEGNTVLHSGNDARSRLTASGNNGRIAEWEVAWKAFEEQPLRGTGAGTYQFRWERDRSESFVVTDGHSLYAEVLGELGLFGLLLVIGTLASILIGLARRLAGSERQAYAATIALTVAWMAHAGVDWDWEMPAVTLGVFALAGLGLARREEAGDDRRSRRRREWAARLAAVACLAALALVPLAIHLSQTRLDTALAKFESGDCAAAITSAEGSLDAIGFRAEPQLVLGYCNARLGHDAKALAAMEAAVEREPDNWRSHYGLALVQAITGRDPLPELLEAQRLNPREERLPKLIRAMQGGDPAQWRRQAQAASLAI